MKFVTTFGASKADKNSKEYKEGIKLGLFLSKAGYIVKCGGYQGLMEAVSIGVHKAGGECIGVTIEKFDQLRPKNPYLTKKIICKTLYERLEKLIEDSRLFVAQSGSIGTMNEVFMILALKYSGFKPDIRICLIGKMYKEMTKCSFIDKNFVKNVEIYENVDEFIKKSNI
ncbi:LOG family protein [Nitrosophilus labii]|uniref:LOG family protein n=1 Tax=Nitrosophilus labii TaxID=2706014 RepID=UPI001656C192|nr:LOG family protein [Nitrosophilus labii]